ncbi:MAG: DNA-binding protein [Gemmatimonadaceae bacterium]|nr:DNA-binding protein [Gemmatimonadaceae bacterium]
MTPWGQAEVLAHLGVGSTTLQWYKTRPQLGFPEPAFRLKMGAVWDAEEVKAWAKTHRRQGTS